MCKVILTISEYWKCDFCNKYFSDANGAHEISAPEVIAKSGHTPGSKVKEKEVAPTCTKAGGYDEVTYCTVCKAELSRTPVTVPKKNHTPGSKVREKEIAATCTKAGSYDEVTYCTVCKLSRTPVTVPKKNHTPGSKVKEKVIAATCTKAGSYDEVTYCTVCKAELSRTPVKVPATGHNYVNGICSDCGDSLIKAISLTPPAKKTYIAGQALDLTGAELSVTFSDNSHKVIAVTAAMVSGYDANRTGRQTLTVTYEGKTAAFEVNVLPAPGNMPVMVNGKGYETLTAALKAHKSGDLDIIIYRDITEKSLNIPKAVTAATLTTAPGAVLKLGTPTITANCDLTLDAAVAAEKANAKTFTVKTVADKTVTVKRLETALPITFSGTKTSNFVLNTG